MLVRAGIARVCAFLLPPPWTEGNKLGSNPVAVPPVPHSWGGHARADNKVSCAARLKRPFPRTDVARGNEPRGSLVSELKDLISLS